VILCGIGITGQTQFKLNIYGDAYIFKVKANDND